MSAGPWSHGDNAAVSWSGPVMVDATSKRVERLVGSKRKELAALDDEFFGEVVGVAEAIYALRTALKQISAALDSRQFEKRPRSGTGRWRKSSLSCSGRSAACREPAYTRRSSSPISRLRCAVRTRMSCQRSTP